MRLNQLYEAVEYNHREFLKWKRKNVTLRGVKEFGKENGVYGSMGKGLYTAFLGNKSMAKEYGDVYYVVNGIPKNPIVLNSINDWEIWSYRNLYDKYGGRREFEKHTNLNDAITDLGYDGVIIKGREMVNYNPENVSYFRTDRELENYYYSNVLNEELTYRHANTQGVEDNEFEIGMVKEGGAPNVIIAYHGTKHKISKFIDDFVGGDNATDQEGPGIYFTTKSEEAIKYAQPDGYVYKVELQPRKLLSNKTRFDFEYLIPSITKLIKFAPNWKGMVKGYDEGLDEMVYKFVSMAQSEKEVFVNLYHEVFKDNAKTFVRGMVKLGYDALYLPARDSGGHVVVYNPNIIKVLGQKAL